jgi:hypothetical protein
MSAATITEAQLHEAEAAESDAQDAYRAAKDTATKARMQFAEQKLAAAGIVLRETICIVNRWGFGCKADRVIVEQATSSGNALCRALTSKNVPHAGRTPFACDIEKLTIEVQS